jgi:hypothetical protein
LFQTEASLKNLGYKNKVDLEPVLTNNKTLGTLDEENENGYACAIYIKVAPSN